VVLGLGNRKTSASKKFIDRPNLAITADAFFAIITTVWDGPVLGSMSTTDLSQVGARHRRQGHRQHDQHQH
jgi:hypothetical protein